MEIHEVEGRVLQEGDYSMIYCNGERVANVFSKEFSSLITNLPKLIDYNKKLIDIIEKLLHKSVDARTYNEAANLINSFEIRKKYGI